MLALLRESDTHTTHTYLYLKYMTLSKARPYGRALLPLPGPCAGHSGNVSVACGRAAASCPVAAVAGSACPSAAGAMPCLFVA